MVECKLGPVDPAIERGEVIRRGVVQATAHWCGLVGIDSRLFPTVEALDKLGIDVFQLLHERLRQETLFAQEEADCVSASKGACDCDIQD